MLSLPNATEDEKWVINATTLKLIMVSAAVISIVQDSKYYVIVIGSYPCANNRVSLSVHPSEEQAACQTPDTTV